MTTEQSLDLARIALEAFQAHILSEEEVREILLPLVFPRAEIDLSDRDLSVVDWGEPPCR